VSREFRKELDARSLLQHLLHRIQGSPETRDKAVAVQVGYLPHPFPFCKLHLIRSSRTPLESPVPDFASTGAFFCSRGRSIREQTERAIHRLRVRKNICELRLDQHQVGADTGLPVVLSTNSTLQFGKVIFRSEVAIILLR